MIKHMLPVSYTHLNLAKMLLDEPENKLENVQKLQQKQVQRNKEDIQI